MRWSPGGVSGGSCWDDSDPQHYTNHEPKPKFKVLDLVIKRLNSDISYLKYREIEELIHTASHEEGEYYGNSTDWEIEYIILSELEKAISKE